MRITAASIRDIKRVRSVKITPDADQTVILIGGQNMQGKTSILDALSMAFGGKKFVPADPVRHGAESGEIVVELDGGDLVIRRVIDKDGDTTLELSDRDGNLRSPQERLNKLIGSRMLDPIAFTLLSAADQRATLLKLIDADNKIAALDERRARIFDKRTDVGRDVTKAKGELERLGPDQVVGQPIDVAALSAERARFADQQRGGDALGAVQREAWQRHKATAAELGRSRSLIAEMLAKIKQLDADVLRCEKDMAELHAIATDADAKVAAAGESWAATAARRDEIDAELKRADAHNRAVYAAEAANKRRREAAELVERVDAQRAEQTKLLDKIDAQKLEILAAAKLPVDGLGIDAHGLVLNGVPFSQASGAEKLSVALALASAASPNLDDIWIRDGALLDDESLRLCAEHAEAAGKRLWIERVGARDPGAIIIQDGLVKEPGE